MCAFSERGNYDRFARTPSSTRPLTSSRPAVRRKRQSKSLQDSQKVYTSLPAYAPAVVHHPDPYMLTPRESVSRAGWTKSRARLDYIPEDDAQEPYRPATTFVSSRDYKQRMRTPRSQSANGPIDVERPWTNQSNRHSHDSSAVTSHVSVRNIKVTVHADRMTSPVHGSHRATVIQVPSRPSSRRNLKADLLLAEWERRYRRGKPAGYSLKKRQEELPLRLQKHCITLDSHTSTANGVLAR